MSWEAWREWAREAPQNVLHDFVELRGMHPAYGALDDDLDADVDRSRAVAEAVSIVLEELADRINQQRRE